MKELQVHQISWKVGNHMILSDVNCRFQQGRFYGIIGPNGSGKTSLIRSLMRFIDPTEGSIHFEGKVLPAYHREEFAKKISLVPQQTGMTNQFSVRDIVMMGRSPYLKRFEQPSGIDHEKVTLAMKLCDCEHLQDQEVSNLSGGEAQRVITARAIAQDTDWVILDEPTASLDVKHQVDLMSALYDMNRKANKTIIAIMHDINLASQYCSDIIMMKEGKVLYQGACEEVLTEKHLEEIYDISFTSIYHPVLKQRVYIPMIGPDKKKQYA